MDSTFYLTVYDAAQLRAFQPWMVVVPALILLASVSALIAWRDGWPPFDDVSRNVVVVPMCCAGIGAAVIVFLIGLIEADGTRRLQSALEDGRYDRVSGRVESFVPGDRGGDQDESFSIGTGDGARAYRYSYSMYTAGFHQSAGPLRAGMEVRIADVRGHIARLEIKQGPGEPPVPRRYRWQFTRHPHRASPPASPHRQPRRADGELSGSHIAADTAESITP